MQSYKKMLLADFYKYHMRKGINSKFYENQLEKLSRFRSYVFLEDITERFIIDYYNYMIKVLGNKEETADKSLKYIKTLYRNALLCGFLEMGINPFERIKFRKYIPEKDKVFIPKSA
jgi:nicotinic acid phosphoribosyltransferase